MPTIFEYLRADPFRDNPLTGDELDLLIDREEIKGRVENLLQSAREGYPQHIAVLGEDGIGKTTMLNFIGAQAQLTPDIYFAKLDITEETDMTTFLQQLAAGLLNSAHLGLGDHLLSFIGFGRRVKQEEILDALKGFTISETIKTSISIPLIKVFNLSYSSSVAKPTPQSVFQLLETLKEVINTLKGGFKAILIMFDEGQYVATSKSVALLQQMRLLLQKGYYMLVLAGSSDTFTRLTEVEPTFLNLFPEHNRFVLALLSRDHVRELLYTRLNRVRKRGEGIQPFTEECIERLTTLSESNPRYVIRIASAALQSNRDKAKITPDMIERSWQQIVYALGRDQFERLEEDEQEIVLTIARLGPISLSEISKNLPTRNAIATVFRKVNHLEERGVISTETRGRERICRLRKALFEYTKDLV